MKKNATARILIACLLVALGSIQSASAGINEWTRSGTGLNSAVNAVLFDPEQPDRLFAGAEDGFYVSEDGGDSWILRGTALGGRSVLSLAVDHRDGGRIFAGVSDGLFISEDGGHGWRRGEGIDSGVFAIASGRGVDTLMYAGTFGHGVFVSLDRGHSWETGGEQLANDIVFSLATSAQGPVLAGTARGLFLSWDGGSSWEALGDSLQGKSVRSVYVSSRPEDSERILAGTFGHGVWRGLDLGKVWQPINRGLADLAVRHLAVDDEFSQEMYAATSTGGVFRTTDGGENWQPINEGLPSLAARRILVVPGPPKRLLGMVAVNGVWEIRFTPEPRLVVEGGLVSLGEIRVGQQARKGLGITNAGEAELRVTSLSVEGNASFSVTPAQLTLAPGETRDIVIRFTPLSRGDKRGRLIISSDDPLEPRVAVDLHGVGLQGELSAKRDAIHFRQVRVGEYRDTTLALINTGNDDLLLHKVLFAQVSYPEGGLAGNTFRPFKVFADSSAWGDPLSGTWGDSLKIPEPQKLTPGQRLLLRLRFVPQESGEVTSRLILVVEGLSDSLEIPVDGVGTTPEIAIAPRALDFGTVSLAGVSVLEMRITNSGNAPLTIGDLVVDGEPFGGEAFGIELALPRVVEPGQTERIPVRFEPLTAGVHRGTARLFSDAPGESGEWVVQLKGTGGGLTLEPLPPVAVGEGAVELLIADWNGDQQPDLAVADSAGGRVRVLLNDGTGTFFETNVFPGPNSLYGKWDQPVALAGAPLFGESLDLIVGDQVARQVSILQNDGEGHFDQHREDIFIGHRVAGLLAADLDADGDADIAVTNRDTTTITLLFNNGLGNFNARVVRPVGAGPVALAAANLDADDHRDLVVGNYGGGTVSVLFSDRRGGYRPRQDFAVGQRPVDLNLMDYDADGDNDILVVCQGTGEVVVLENERLSGGESRFVLARRVHVGLGVVDMAMSDLTADLFSDLVIAGEGMARLVFLENQAGSGFATRDTLIQEAPRRIEVADLTGDGANDIVALHTDFLQLYVNQDTRRQDPPRPPTRVTAGDAGRDLGGRTELLWEAPELDEQIGRTTEYVIYRLRRGLNAAAAADTFAAIDTVAAGIRRFVDLQATLADTFFYYVRAGHAGIYSLSSDTVSAVSRPAPFFELQLVDQQRLSIGDTLRVRAFITPAEHPIAGVSLYLTFADSVLRPIYPAEMDTAAGGKSPFRISAALETAMSLENRLHPNTAGKANLSLAELRIQPGVEAVELGEIWFETLKDTVSFISIDDEPEHNRRSAVVETGTGTWLLPFIPAQPLRVAVRDFQVKGRVRFAGRGEDELGLQVSLLFIDESGDTLRSPLNDEDRLKSGIQRTLAPDGRFSLDQIPGGMYKILVKAPTHLQGQVIGDSVTVGEPQDSLLSFRWIKSDLSVHPELPAGDANDDNRINLADFGLFVQYFQVTRDILDVWSRARAADFDGDGAVGMDDFFLLAEAFGEVGMEVAAREEAGKSAAGSGRARIESGTVRVEELGEIRGFSLFVPKTEKVEVDLDESIWEGRDLSLFQWREKGGVRIAGGLGDGSYPVVGDGILARLGDSAAGRVDRVAELEVLAAGGRVHGIQLVPGAVLPRHSALLANFPNPFNPTTTIPFVVGTVAGEHAQTRLEIFNALGQKVRILHAGRLEAGTHRVTWDGRDRQGQQVASGVYLYRLQIGDFQQHRRLLIAR